MILENVKGDFSVIKQVMALQNMKTAELEATWGKYFDHPPEVASRQHMTAKIAYKIQEMFYGAVDAETEEKIKACAKKNSNSDRSEKENSEIQSDDRHENHEGISRKNARSFGRERRIRVQ